MFKHNVRLVGYILKLKNNGMCTVFCLGSDDHLRIMIYALDNCLGVMHIHLIIADEHE